MDDVGACLRHIQTRTAVATAVGFAVTNQSSDMYAAIPCTTLLFPALAKRASGNITEDEVELLV